MSSKRTYKKYTAAEKAAYYKRKNAAKPKQPYKRNTRKPRPTASVGTVGGIVGSALGGALAGPGGAAVGHYLGKGAQEMFQSLVGFGDYRLNGNTLMTGGMSPPQMVNSINRGGYIVRHREYLGDVLATETFTSKVYPLNPGIQTFPWLSQIAGSFEQYKFRGLVFEFRSTSSDAVLSTATSSALGTVIMATQYNVLNPPFASKLAMENYEFANSDKPSCSFYHPIECMASRTPVALTIRSHWACSRRR